MLRIHNEINGRWLRYWSTKRRLNAIKSKSEERISFYDYESHDPWINGSLPSEREWQLERPNYQTDEYVAIHGVNSIGQFIRVSILKRKSENGKSFVRLSVELKVREDRVFSICEDFTVNVVDAKRNEYKAGPLLWEIINPFRRLRLKFRGYLRDSASDELIYIRFRLHWYSLSNAFDHKCNFSTEFVSQQLVKYNSETVEVDDCIEQFGQIKGTFHVDDDSQRELFLWGLRSKRVDQNDFKVSRLIGIAKNGCAFDVGFVANENKRIKYCYGLVKNEKGIVNGANGISFTGSELECLSSNLFAFTIETNAKTVNVTVKEKNELLIRDAIVGDADAKCMFIFDDYFANLGSTIIEFPSFAYSVCDVKEDCDELVLPLTEPKAQSVILSGGKGSSLVALKRLSEIHKSNFKVPKGMVVTSNAYSLLLKERVEVFEAIENLQKLTWAQKCDLKTECNKVEHLISQQTMPESVKLDIDRCLHATFGAQLSHKHFAVRSSAVGEDSEEMSGAGQLTTFLNVKGLDAIYDAVMKCWSSQFGLNFTEYKRGYGQLINNTMAVVILEMVDCDTAGVIFTCDPLTGDERTVVVTANYGLGESVVSASSEPDTIRVTVEIEGNDLKRRRVVKEIEKIEIGRKEKYIKMNDNGEGTVELDVVDKQNCCVSKEDLLKLAQVSVDIHAYYGNARDIEWGIKDGDIYMLQSRPLTSLDHSYTEWELMHDLDTGFQEENGLYSRLHWNENFPGCCSPLCVTFITQMLDGYFQVHTSTLNGIRIRLPTNYCPYYRKSMPTYYNQLFLNFREVLISNSTTKLEKMAFVGRELNDEDLMVTLQERQAKMKFSYVFNIFYNAFKNTIFSSSILRYVEKWVKQRQYFPKKESQTSLELYTEMCLNARQPFEAAAWGHSNISLTAGFHTLILLKLLSQKEGDEDAVFYDFGCLQIANKGIISAEVPKLLRDIVLSIEEKKKFQEMSDEEALKFLQSGESVASKKFLDFLQRHGYRGLKEMDPAVLQWADEPIKLIPLLKSTVITAKEDNTKTPSISELISKLRTKPSFFRRILLRIFIPLSFRGTRYREQTKSNLAYYVSKYREGFWCLAKKMAFEEGRLPEPELMFFLTLHEIGELIKERNPLLVAKAMRKKRIQQKMDKFLFPDVVKDWELKPLNNEKPIDSALLKGALTLKGTAVTSLSVTGRLCVAATLEDAKHLKNGDILLTHTTDIGWSPYFPMVSGVITEMGGLNSHGAVIAREYGLPCLIGVMDACSLFKSGDIVYLNCENGSVTRIEE